MQEVKPYAKRTEIQIGVALLTKVRLYNLLILRRKIEVRDPYNHQCYLLLNTLVHFKYFLSLLQTGTHQGCLRYLFNSSELIQNLPPFNCMVYLLCLCLSQVGDSSELNMLLCSIGVKCKTFY